MRKINAKRVVVAAWDLLRSSHAFSFDPGPMLECGDGDGRADQGEGRRGGDVRAG